MKRDFIIYSIIALVGALFFIPFIGRLHLLDWDEINFAECAREMIVTGDYLNVQIFFEPFWEKPPIFIWLQVLAMKIFGVNEFAARLPNAVCGIITLALLYHYGKQIKDEKFGLFWAGAYLCSFLPFLYFKSGIIDPWFNLFIFLSIIYWVKTMNLLIPSYKYRTMAMSGIFLGLAILTKGPAAVVIFGLTIGILVLVNKLRFQFKMSHFLVFVTLLLLTGSSWFIVQIFSGNYDTVVDFIVYQIRLFKEKDAGHGGFPMYHFIILLFGVFPASVFAIHGHKKYTVDNEQFLLMRRTMVILFWVVLILFSIVNTKIVHYSSMCYYPLTFLAAYAVHNIWHRWAHLPNRFYYLLAIIGIIPSLAVIAIPIFDRNKQWFIDNELVSHSFTVGNLQADPGWGLWIMGIGILLLAGIILSIVLFKKGIINWAFYVLGGASLFFIYLSILFITPGAEKYSQHAAIEFIKEKGKEDAYVQTFYKSYAMLFYTKAEKPNNPMVFNETWLAKGDIDKKVFFVMRIDKKDYVLKLYPEVEVMYEKNGYVFCVRYPKPKNKEVKVND